MTTKITNIEDLAAYLGAATDSEKSIARRVYKDTSCGCPAGVSDAYRNPATDRWVAYTVQCGLSILGWKVLTWRPAHGKRRWAYQEAMPTGLAEYLAIGEQRKGRSPVICELDMEPKEVVREFGRAWMDAVSLNGQVLRKTFRRGGMTVYLTVRVKEPGRFADGQRLYFWVAGYCEGSDVDHEVYEVPFPCTPEAIDAASRAADKDGIATWNATHGCEHCHTAEMTVEQTDQGWRISWDKGDSWWTEKDVVQHRPEEWEIRAAVSEKLYEWENCHGQVPINPDCPSCKGQGQIL
jgi:hypothetical protein